MSCGCTDPCQPNSIPCTCEARVTSDCVTVSGATSNCLAIDDNLLLTDYLTQMDERICEKVDSVTNFIALENVGTGSQLYKGDSLLGKKQIRTVKSIDPNLVVTQTDDEIQLDLNIPAIVPPDGTETKLVSGTNTTVAGNGSIATPYSVNVAFPTPSDGSETKINAGTNVTVTGNGTDATPYIINSLANGKEVTSSTLIITEDEFSINIETPSINIGELKTFYVNSNYVPTIDSPSDGSIIRPYLTYDEAKTAFIGTGDITTPQFIGSKIILQTNSTTALNPTVNELILEFEDISTLVYTGTDLYMFDTEILYSLIPKNTPRQDLTKRIKISLTGFGQITRTAGIGLVRGMGSNRVGLAEYGDPFSEIYLGLKSSDILYLAERVDYPSDIWDGDITNVAGITYESMYGSSHKYSLQLFPTTPLIYTKYNNINNSSTRGVNSFGTLNITNLANTSIKIDGSDTLFTADIVNFEMHTNRIATSSATKMVDYTSYYYPRTNKNFVEGSGGLYCKKVTAGRPDNLRVTGVDSFFKFTDNATFYYGELDINSVYYANKFINISDVSNTNTTYSISNTLEGSSIKLPCRYFIDTNLSTINIVMPNTQIAPCLNKSTTVVNIIPDTKGTLSTFFNKPVISGIDNYIDDTAATIAGLITNSLYFNTTNNAIDKI